MLTLDLQRSNDNLAVHGKIIIHLSTNVSTPLNATGPSAASGGPSLTTDTGVVSSSGSVTSPNQVLNNALTSPPSVSGVGTSVGSSSDNTAAVAPAQEITRNDATSAPNNEPPTAAAATTTADRNFSATEDQYGPLPAGWERRTDHLGRTYYVRLIAFHIAILLITISRWIITGDFIQF